MAFSWKTAQEREKDFWESIYVRKKTDIQTYQPMTEARADEFCAKTLFRFGITLNDFDNEGRILDLGCGPAGLVKGLYDRFGKENRKLTIHGIDPLMDTYKTFGTLPAAENVILAEAKGEQLPYESNFFDHIFCINVLDHVENPRLTLAECRRVLRPGGGLHIAVHVIYDALTLALPLLPFFDKNHPHHFTEGKVAALCRDHFTCEISGAVSMLEDQPDFTLLNCLRRPGLRSVKRWGSNYILKTLYLNCKKQD
jgi:SAM-dependent methyltransferase